ncbi:MAG TPA: OmpH family outer membrane protein, partial [Cyclobacteriaceae bacterium]|nr:OmpH family outer membrane protein [Cyclobacteriaceae bacterium]
MRTLLLLIFCSCLALTTSAQTPVTQKIGYADWEYIFQQMPEFKQITDQLTTHSTQLENQFKAKQQEFETKLRAYQANMATMNDVVKKSTETELTQLQDNLQKFQQDATANIQTKQTALMEPVFAKVGKAIEDVAKENGYDFILAPQIAAQGGGDILLYSSE